MNWNLIQRLQLGQRANHASILSFSHKPNGKHAKSTQEENLVGKIQKLEQQIRRLKRIRRNLVIDRLFLEEKGQGVQKQDVQKLEQENRELEVENAFLEAEIADFKKQMKLAMKKPKSRSKKNKRNPRRQYKYLN